ncbi:glycoside hydrolase family 25 protein [Budvicia diplopodorum]|uniref:glycoside hydrolase family 25 protein n=1 Tax=Budvicia diplopodorum TaxID=1119056 RepID=UPI00135C3F44|nr:GH25 family lysozyme [Budvicia diplopodorum]
MPVRYLLWIIIAIIGIGALTIYSLYHGYLRFNYPTLAEFPIQGIDISNHQKQIDWDSIDKDKVRFIFVKASEGADFKDKSFKANWESARKRNFIVGAYHFFTFCKSGEQQAKNFIETVPHEPGILPPIIDLEYGGNCQSNLSKEQVITEITVLINRLEAFYHKKPILYVTSEFFDDYAAYQFEGNPIWIRNIYRQPLLTDGRSWTFWQYGNRGRIEGIDTFVDLNVFHGTEQAFDALIQ